jgi:hypothetical protein
MNSHSSDIHLLFIERISKETTIFFTFAPHDRTNAINPDDIFSAATPMEFSTIPKRNKEYRPAQYGFT